jgi:DNA-binding PadR family transcriptional regulator
MSQPSDFHEQLPLTETTFYLFLSMAGGPRHGYAILKDVQELSAGRVVLSTGTLYGAIKRLVEQGLIERIESSPLAESIHPRKEYQLTSLGKRLFEAEFARLQNLVSAARTRISGEQA